MKKTLFTVLFVFTVAFAVIAQQDAGIPGQSVKTKSAGQGGHRGFLSVSAGPALPMGDFGVTETDADGSPGFATGGFSMMLNIGYRIINNVGITATVFRATHNLEADGEDLSDTSTPWVYGGFLAGGLITSNTNPINFNGHVMAGFASAATPDLGGFLIEESAGAFAFMIGAGVQIHLVSILFITIKADYFSTKPYFSESDFDQPIGALNLNGGLGIMF